MEYSKYSHECMHVFILTRMPYGIDPPLIYTSPKISVPTTGFCKLCVMVQCHAAWEVSTANSGSELASPPIWGPNPSARVFWLGLLKTQALQQNGGLDLEFPKIQDCCVWNFVIGSSLEAPIWIYFCVPHREQWLALWRKPVSWSETCFSASQGILRAMENFNCRTAQFWVASGKKGGIVGKREHTTIIPQR